MVRDVLVPNPLGEIIQSYRDDIITAALAFFMDSHYQMECVACNSQQCLILNIYFLIVCMCI